MPRIDDVNVVTVSEPLDWRTLPLPAPWTWHNAPNPSRRYTLDDTILIGIGPNTVLQDVLTLDNYIPLKEWAESCDVILQAHNNVRVMDNGVMARRPNWFTLRINSLYSVMDRGYIQRYNYFNQSLYGNCRSCGVLVFGDIQTCSNCDARTGCGHCGAFLSPDDTYVSSETHGDICSHCGHPCREEGCENLSPQYHDYCAEHEIVDHCSHCGEEWFRSVNEEPVVNSYRAFSSGREVFLCNSSGNRCERFFCIRCGVMAGEYSLGEAEGTPPGTYCDRCRDAVMYGDNTEEFDDKVNMNAPSLQIPTIPGRENIRLVGVEIEGGNWNGNGSDIAEELYRQGLSRDNRIFGYHHGDGGFAHVEQDSTVDWEMVVGPVNMANIEQVRKLNNAIKIVKKAIANETIKLDLRCGTHIHVGAERVSVASAFNLHHIYAYAEDVLYRLGAAKWPIHRAIRNNSQYCLPIRKYNDFRQFAQHQGEHHNGLFFGNYFGAMMNSCVCGAVRYGQWEQCTCSNLGKCTFEFRIFNATANQRKLHAYLALTQALVAQAGNMGIVSGEDADALFPGQPWQSVRYKDLSEARRTAIKDGWAPRLNYLVNDLPLTDKERASVRYCVESSELNELGSEIIDSIFEGTFGQEIIETQEVNA